ncbi:MAG: hypothetical protein ACRCYU_14370 [Nocardioides sp.]
MVTELAGPGVAVRGLECLPPEVDGRTVVLRYASDGAAARHQFAEVVEFPAALDRVAPRVLDGLLRLLSLAASLSYFKAFAPASIAVTGGLTSVEREFLRKVTVHGLGEFAYVNNLPEVFDSEILAPEATADRLWTGDRRGAGDRDVRRALVAVGGGKDSIVSIEALRSSGVEVELFSVNSYGPIEATAKVAGLRLNTVRRRLDPALFELNRAGAPNGHVPVTAVNSLLAVICAAALDFDTVVFSNEASSSYGNVEWHGRQINHQWSKSIEFERLLRASLPAEAPGYVSLLRPLSELRIARRFAQHTAYHGVFTSCNRAFKLREADRTSWCADCPKCRFVFLCLAPFLTKDALLRIFGGRDMFADSAQLPGFLELLGGEGHLKPFECVGEPDECRVALELLREHPDWREHPFLSRPEVSAYRATDREAEDVFAFREGEHFLNPLLEAAAREV